MESSTRTGAGGRHAAWLTPNAWHPGRGCLSGERRVTHPQGRGTRLEEHPVPARKGRGAEPVDEITSLRSGGRGGWGEGNREGPTTDVSNDAHEDGSLRGSLRALGDGAGLRAVPSADGDDAETTERRKPKGATTPALRDTEGRGTDGHAEESLEVAGRLAGGRTPPTSNRKRGRVAQRSAKTTRRHGARVVCTADWRGGELRSTASGAVENGRPEPTRTQPGRCREPSDGAPPGSLRAPTRRLGGARK